MMDQVGRLGLSPLATFVPADNVLEHLGDLCYCLLFLLSLFYIYQDEDRKERTKEKQTVNNKTNQKNRTKRLGPVEGSS